MKMQKKDLKKMALLGLAGGIALSQTIQADENLNNYPLQLSSLLAANTTNTQSNSSSKTEIDPNAGNLGYHLMSEDELMLELNADGQRMYNALTPEYKKLALEVASARCANMNACKFLNACKTDKNDCAGKASCKGQGKCAIADKNLAVRLVYDKMMKKRAGANNGE
jgi:hypothetical protein